MGPPLLAPGRRTLRTTQARSSRRLLVNRNNLAQGSGSMAYVQPSSGYPSNLPPELGEAEDTSKVSEAAAASPLVKSGAEAFVTAAPLEVVESHPLANFPALYGVHDVAQYATG